MLSVYSVCCPKMNPDVIDNSEVKLLANNENFDVDKKSKETAMGFSNFDEEPAAVSAM